MRTIYITASYKLSYVIIHGFQTWENRSFQSERHMETSYAVTAASETEESWNMLLRVTQIPPINSDKEAKMKATKLPSASNMRTGAYSISQRVQNIGHRTEVPEIQRNKNNIQLIQGFKDCAARIK